MTSSQKDVIYIDVADEITGVIEKVQASSGKIVALVLPKRAAVFQSIVNMKLLKRSADSANKNLVLITSEASLMPLAGAVGLHVAKTAQSKPVIPDAPAAHDDAPVSVDEVEVGEAEKPLDKTASIGSLAGLPPQPDDEDAIEVDNDDKPAVAAAGAAKAFNKKLKVPDFNSFRNRLLLGGGALVALIILWLLTAVVLPRASITIKTDSTEVNSKISVTASPTITEADFDKKIIPGVLKEYKKSDSQKVPATGQKDMGTKASGTVTLSLTDCSKEQVTVPAGTTVSSGNFNFITQVDVSMQSVKIGPNCKNSDFKDISTAKVKVEAQNAGDSYNLSARNYSVAGFSNVSGAGGAMSGGTSKIVKVVSQQDVDNAKQKIIDAVSPTANQDISNQLKTDGYFPIADTFTAKDPLVVSNPAVGTEATEATVNVTLSFTMVGAKRDALVKLLEDDIKQQIDESKQHILNNGLDNAAVRIDVRKPNGETSFTLEARATAGVEQNEADIKKSVYGKKKSEVRTIIGARPGVKEVDVRYSPFWVTKVPKSDGKITIKFENQQSSDNE